MDVKNQNLQEELVPKTRPTVQSVQWLRGIAALMVVIHHARASASWIFNPLENYNGFAYGVDIFFVISGFIMFVAAREESPLVFLRRRAVRVVPLYWIATIGLLIASPKIGFFAPSSPEIDHIIKSLLFVPHYSPTPPGNIWPVLVPGWTLNYEMFFYLVFFVGLWVKRPLAIVASVIPFLVFLGLLIDSPKDALFTTYTSVQMLEFVAGILIGKLYIENLLPSMLFALLPLGTIGLFCSDFLALGLPGRIAFSSAILIGTVVADRFLANNLLLKGLGDASYSIYLSHTILGLPLAKRLFSLIPTDGWVQFLLWMVVATACSTAVGYLIHRLVEKPTLSWLRHKLDRPRAA